MTSAQCPDNNHPHMIDLGLPSGTKWACCNVGAEKPEDSGGYYAWGETEEKGIYDWSTYIHCDGSEKNCYDIGQDISATDYDVAHVKWGGLWMMPCGIQFNELLNYCTYEYTVDDGMNGLLFTGPNGCTLFFPAMGTKMGSSIWDDGEGGSYWTSSHYSGYESYSFIFHGSAKLYNDSFRSYGRGVRPVAGFTIDVTLFPDDKFHQFVLENYDLDGNNMLSGYEIREVTIMQADNKGIADLKGIECFYRLKNLNCSNNNLTSIDLSKNTALTTLYCGGNRLVSLNLSKNTALSLLDCVGNQLTSLDLSMNTALKTLYCGGNQLASLDLSMNTMLVKLFCENNYFIGSAMDALIIGLPTKTGSIYPIDINYCEQNKMTKAQVASAKEKGWTTYYWNSEKEPDRYGTQWDEYEGFENQTNNIYTLENFISNILSEHVTIYNLNGQRVNQPSKGVYIKNGKKVLVK